MPMLLAIDVGNTRIKYAVFEYDTILRDGFFAKEDLQTAVEKILQTHKKITDLAVASVGSIGKTAFQLFEKRVNIHFISHESRFPFDNQYATPATLGID